MSKASSWRQRATAEIHCPSGETVTVARVPKEALLTCGHVPAPLMEVVIKAYRMLDERSADAQPTTEQLLAMPEIVDATLIAALRYNNPRAVMGAAKDETEIDVRDIPAEDRTFIFTEAQKSFPQIPVQTEGGETSMEALAKFPDEAGTPPPHYDGAGQARTFQPLSGNA